MVTYNTDDKCDNFKLWNKNIKKIPYVGCLICLKGPKYDKINTGETVETEYRTPNQEKEENEETKADDKLESLKKLIRTPAKDPNINDEYDYYYLYNTDITMKLKDQIKWCKDKIDEIIQSGGTYFIDGNACTLFPED